MGLKFSIFFPDISEPNVWQFSPLAPAETSKGLPGDTINLLPNTFRMYTLQVTTNAKGGNSTTFNVVITPTARS